MTQKEKNGLNETIKSLEDECNTLENLYLDTKNINFRWSKQRLEKVIIKFKKLCQN